MKLIRLAIFTFLFIVVSFFNTNCKSNAVDSSSVTLNVSGVVTDLEDKPKASVLVKLSLFSWDKGKSETTYSNSKGEYSIMMECPNYDSKYEYLELYAVTNLQDSLGNHLYAIHFWTRNIQWTDSPQTINVKLKKELVLSKTLL